jgi:2'-5' RNA ligase
MNKRASRNSTGRKRESAAKVAVALQTRYDQLWSDGIAQIRAGAVEVDAVLAARKPDQRRGLTVIARPSARVKQTIACFVRKLRHIDPQQYYYLPAEFHVTVLSLFTATADHEPFFALQDRFVAAVDGVLKRLTPICIRFIGVTVSPGTVMVQGFLEGEDLNRLRDDLRHQLRDNDLATTVDQRYRLCTAHMTIARFRCPMQDSAAFALALEGARRRVFGTTTVREMFLVSNDWYMSRRATRSVKRYRLASLR